MICDRALRAASAAADGELDDRALAQLADHLAGCPTCRAFDRSVHRFRSQLRFEPIAGPPGTAGVPDVVPALRSRLGGATRPARADHRLAQPVSTPAAVDQADGADGAAEPETAVAPRGDGGRLGASGRDAPPGSVRGDDRATWRGHVRVAAVAAAVGMFAGATFVGIGRDPQPPARADLAEQVLTAQHDITTLEARFRLAEGDRRSFDGTLVYEAPETLVLRLAETASPSPEATEPADGDVRLEVAEDRWRLDTVRRCASCPAGVAPWHQVVTGREPFSDAAPVPLELVTAVDSFALTGPLPQLDRRTVAGREAVGVRVPAAQVADFLEALSPAGDLRPVHPTDPAEVWLERDHLVPLLVEVRAGASAGRDRWAASQGFADPAGALLLRYEVDAIAVNDGSVTTEAVDPVPGQTIEQRDDGFRAGDAVVVPEPAYLPQGLRPHLTGTVDTPDGPRVGVRSWTDGRAWVKVRATDQWTAARLFGSAGTGPDLRPVDLGPAGVGYLSAEADSVALHADGLDVVVTGSLPGDQLQAIAASLGVMGLPIPATWPEAATATLADARAALPQVLVVPDLEGFAAPAIRVDGTVVTQVYTGPGDRGFLLTQSPQRKLSPPADQDSLAVTVRGVPGRYSVRRGELEWVTADGSYSLASPTLSMDELAAVADRLEPP